MKVLNLNLRSTFLGDPIFNFFFKRGLKRCITVYGLSCEKMKLNLLQYCMYKGQFSLLKSLCHQHFFKENFFPYLDLSSFEEGIIQSNSIFHTLFICKLHISKPEPNRKCKLINNLLQN